MAKKILVFQHVPYEILGTFDPLIREHAVRIRYVNFARGKSHRKIDVRSYHALIVLGGPMGVYESAEYPHLLEEVSLIKEALREGLSIFGICLGSQLLAHALGAAVYPHTQREIGWYKIRPTEEAETDPLFSHFKGSEMLFQWHQDTFDLPEGAIRLATGEGCLNQAFRYGDRAYGLQFHLEVDKPLIERWLTLPDYRPHLESLDRKLPVEGIRKETTLYLERVLELSGLVFGTFLDHLGTHSHWVRLPSHFQRGKVGE